MDLLEKKVFEQSGAAIVRHPWELAREKIIKSVIRNNFKKIPPSLLDVGCGDGYIITSIATEFKSGSFSGVDIELTPGELVEMNMAAPGNLHFYNKLDQTNDNVSGINGFTLMDVLEHVPDDTFLLNQISHHPKTEQGSLFFITVPAWQFLFTDHDVFLKHFRRYTKSSLRETMRRAELKEQEIHYFFFSLFLLRFFKSILLKVLNKKEKTVMSDLVWKHGAGSSKLVADVLYAEYVLMRLLSKIGIHLPGLSVFGLCKKQ